MIKISFKTPPAPALFRAAVFLCLLLFAGACSISDSPPPTPPGHPKPYRVNNKWYQPIPHAGGFKERGIASWYGKKFHGRKTAGGEVYNMYGISAAHKTLPIDTYVNVRNLDNGKEIVARINDRGPFVSGRIIDLSYGAAKKIAMIGPGTANVEITALGALSQADAAAEGTPTYVPLDYESGNFTVQVGAFSERGNAVRLQKKLQQQYASAHIVPFEDGSRIFYRVRVGRYTTLTDVRKAEEKFILNGFEDAFPVAE